MRTSGGARVSCCASSTGLPMCAFALPGCLRFSLSFTGQDTVCSRPPLLPEFGRGPASHFTKRSPCFVICSQGDNLSRRSTGKTALKRPTVSFGLCHVWTFNNGPNSTEHRQVQTLCKGWGARPLLKSFIGPLLVGLFFVVVVFKCNNFCIV